MHVLPLRNDLFLLAHDDAGKRVVPEASINAGLAGATLIDLLLSCRVRVADGRLDVVDPALTGDGEADATLDAIAANKAPCGPRAWVRWISNGAYERVAAALGAAGVVRRTTTRPLGLLTVSRCVPCNIEDLVRVRSRLRYAIHSRDVPDPATAALCGLVLVLNLESALLLSMNESDLRLALERMAAPSEATVRQVANAVETVITTASHR